MMKRSFGTVALVAALIAVLAVPVFAEARRQTPRGMTAKAAARAKVSTGVRRGLAVSKAASMTVAAKRKGQPTTQLQKRITNVLSARGHRFDAVTANLTKRIDRLSALVATIAAAGGDVTGATADLDAARQHLASALSLEAETRALLQQVPSSADRKVAFKAARAKGRAAVAELKLTRSSIRSAVESLRVVVDDLRSETASGTAD